MSVSTCWKASCVPFVRSDPELVRKGFKVANLKPGELVVELGCGDAQNLIIAAKEFGARGIGIEINPQRVAEALSNIHEAGVEDKVEIIHGNFMDAEDLIAKADLVYCYLTPQVNELVKPMLEKYPLRVLSLTFSFSGWKPTAIIDGKMYYYDRRGEEAETKTEIIREKNLIEKILESL